MTAAHCVLDDNPNKYTVILGDVDQYKNEGLEQEFQVNRIIKHPSYSHPVPYENDIALFQLKKPAQRSDAVNTACLPGFLEEAPVGMECYISGKRKKSITACNCMSGPLLWTKRANRTIDLIERRVSAEDIYCVNYIIN